MTILSHALPPIILIVLFLFFQHYGSKGEKKV